MVFNTILAFIPILLVLLLRRRLNIVIHLIVFFFWLLFLPNTIYLVTDLQHLPFQLFRVGMGEQLILLIQFSTLAALGVMTYVYSLEPIALIFRRLKLPDIKREILYIGLNYIISFGVIMGKVQRTHSWYIFTEPGKVVRDLFLTLTNAELLTWVLVFGSIVNVLFFLFKDYFPPLRNTDKKKKK
jgi:uncharacterized membrane protein